jgi:hypothetical protein
MQATHFLDFEDARSKLDSIAYTGSQTRISPQAIALHLSQLTKVALAYGSRQQAVLRMLDRVYNEACLGFSRLRTLSARRHKYPEIKDPTEELSERIELAKKNNALPCLSTLEQITRENLIESYLQGPPPPAHASLTERQRHGCTKTDS